MRPARSSIPQIRGREMRPERRIRSERREKNFHTDILATLRLRLLTRNKVHELRTAALLYQDLNSPEMVDVETPAWMWKVALDTRKQAMEIKRELQSLLAQAPGAGPQTG